MTPEQIKLVQDSFAKVAPIADKAAEIFYSTLFTMDPSLKKLFKGDMKEQGKKLMASIKMVVLGLNNLPAILPGVNALAVRHVAYGVKKEHYDTVGAALISTLEKGLGDAFTPDVKKSWLEAYTILSSTMIKAAY